MGGNVPQVASQKPGKKPLCCTYVFEPNVTLKIKWGWKNKQFEADFGEKENYTQLLTKWLRLAEKVVAYKLCSPNSNQTRKRICLRVSVPEEARHLPIRPVMLAVTPPTDIRIPFGPFGDVEIFEASRILFMFFQIRDELNSEDTKSHLKKAEKVMDKWVILSKKGQI